MNELISDLEWLCNKCRASGSREELKVSAILSCVQGMLRGSSSRLDELADVAVQISREQIEVLKKELGENPLC